MGFLSLLMVASMPVVQVLLIGLLGAFLATKNINVLTPTALKDINKVLFHFSLFNFNFFTAYYEF